MWITVILWSKPKKERVWMKENDFLKIFYLFIHERPTERGRDTGRGRSRLPAGSPMWDSIPGPGISPGVKADA